MESNGNDKKELMKAEDRAVALANEPSVFLNVAKFEQMQRVAVMLSKTDFIPAAFKNNVGNCMIALDMASLMGMHPIMLMRTMYIVHGQPGFEGKFISALINNSGRYNDPLEYEWRGKQGEPQWGCRAFAVRKSTGKTVYGPWVDWRMVQSEGWHKPKGTQPSKWTSIPEIMFLYRAATFFGRVNDSDLLMGMRTIDEIEDTDAELVRQPDGAYGMPSNEKPTAATYAATGKPPEQSVSDPKQEISTGQDQPAKQDDEISPDDNGNGEKKDQDQLDQDTDKSNVDNVDEYGTALDSPWAKSKWFNARSGDPAAGTGLGAYVEMFKDRLCDISETGWEVLKDKYRRVYMGSEIPYGPDGEPAGQPAEQQQAAQPGGNNVLESQEARQLAQMAQDHKRQYIMVVKNRIPESIEQINSWMHQIQDLVLEHADQIAQENAQAEKF